MLSSQQRRTPESRTKHAKLLNAAALKTHYAVYGHFYSTNLAGEHCSCRSALTLIRRDCIPSELAQLDALPPDLLVVMMNPGSSYPLDKAFTPPHIEAHALGQAPRCWMATKPDNTQYQIMRVMAAMGYQHGRILNISDLRETKSPRLVAKVTALASHSEGGLHALFAPQRQAELHGLLGDDLNVPIVIGWGRHKGLLPLARQAMTALQGRTLVGIEVEPLRYAHPSPMLQVMKDAWLQTVIAHLSQLSQ
ncbi:conserved hypothetical protein [Magnetococcus marinus MC-1]|uniref:DUF1643 domain-containing protein n=1 Tax=Magnetococcus marinus (strain ATCC BAA-1437 / JCM 17883 / MC-1) TaxID=156889 RepID=A0L8P0_MAGMM|nr:hypothetical protein [Magnetococcus marinus]ABK44333.1 conserved hypothetical protein [Magnetococcus marinus MC-1]